MSDKMSTKNEVSTPTSDVANGSMNEDWTVAEETAIRRKFDVTITPLVTVMYMLCAIDR